MVILYILEKVLAEKNVIKVDKDKVDTCNRFKTKIDCNNPNSFSLDSRKCVFNERTNKCVSSLFEKTIITDKDIWEYIPDDEELKLVWLDALTQSKIFILQETENKNLGDIGINNLIKDPAEKLLDPITKTFVIFFLAIEQSKNLVFLLDFQFEIDILFL